MSAKVLIIVSQENFQPAEYMDTRQELEKAGIEVKVATAFGRKAYASDGTSLHPDFAFKNVNLDDFKAIAVIGGPGALSLGRNADFLKFIQEADAKEKIIAAICVSPLNLAKAGLLRGKKVTVWCDLGKTQAREIAGYGAQYVNEPVVVDGRFITANGPNAAKDFGKKIAEVLQTKGE